MSSLSDLTTDFLSKRAVSVAGQERSRSIYKFPNIAPTGPLCTVCKDLTTYNSYRGWVLARYPAGSSLFNHGSGEDILQRASGRLGCQLCYEIVNSIRSYISSQDPHSVEEFFQGRSIKSTGYEGKLKVVLHPQFVTNMLCVVSESELCPSYARTSVKNEI